MKLRSIHAVLSALVIFAFTFFIQVGNTSAEVLDTLKEYGNAGDASKPINPAGNPRGADFSQSASGTYSITAGGTDHWGSRDNGSWIYDADGVRAAGSNFSAVVRSVSIAADPLEPLGNNWGRTGLMARQLPDEQGSPNVSHIRRDGNNAWTSLQGRKNLNQGTDRNGGEMGNGQQAAGNPFDRTRPFWLALHRVDGFWYANWASDDNGQPGEWSEPRKRNDSGNNMNGEVYVGLAHQSHGNNSAHDLGGNTAVFDNFQVIDFAGFKSTGTRGLARDGNNILATANEVRLGQTAEALEDQQWRVDYIASTPTEINYTTGKLKADIYTGRGNGGNKAAFDLLTRQTPNGSTEIETIDWERRNYGLTNAAGVNLFAEAVPGQFGGDQGNYAVNVTGEIFIPNDADRGGRETVEFHDGNDDFTLLVIDGVKIIENNQASNRNANNGTLGSFDCSDPKFDDGEWVSIQFGMWEGGGGDSASLAWNGVTAEGWNTNNINVNNRGNLTHQGFRIPSANYRIPNPNYVESTQSGEGSITDLVLDNEISPEAVKVELYVGDQLSATIDLIPTIASNDFTNYQEVTINVQDGEKYPVDEAAPITVTDLDGNAFSATYTRAEGSNQVSVVVDVGEQTPLSTLSLNISGSTTTAGVGFSYSVDQEAFPFYTEMRAGLDTPPNSTVGWQVMEWTGKNGYLAGINAIRNDAPNVTEVVPFINFYDPENGVNGIGGVGAGDWSVDDRPYLTNTGANDDQIVTFARTTWTATAGDYTIRVRGDDGYGLRIQGGATVVRTKGEGRNKNGGDGASSYFTDGTGNSNAWIHVNIPADGDYIVEWFGFEGGGGANQEILINSGHHENFNTNGWELFGNMGEYNRASRWGEIPSSVLPLLPQEGTDEDGWSTKIWYSARNGSNQEVGNLDQTMRFIRDIEAGTSTFGGFWEGFLPSLNHSLNGGNKGRINPTEAYPRPTAGNGDFRGDKIAMVAHARLDIPADGDYTVQVRSDDGFLMRFVDPNNTFHTENGNGKLEMTYTSEIVHDGGTGDSNTRAAAFLTAGTHDLIFVWWEGGGGDHFEVSVVNGVEMNQNAAFVLLSSETGESPNRLDVIAKAPNRDSDDDGLLDEWELANFGDLDETPEGDTDSDGRTNAQELAAGTSGAESDTDGDGLNDGAEFTANTDPLNTDSDGDGVTDGDEVLTYQSNPLNVNSDGDCADDGVEVAAGTNPTNPNSQPWDQPILYLDFEDGIADGSGNNQTIEVRNNIAYGNGASWPGAEGPEKLVDGNFGSKYLSWAGAGAGVIVTATGGAAIIDGLVLSTANDTPNGDPAAYILYGTNDAITTTTNNHGDENWTKISSGALALPGDRNLQGAQTVTFANTEAYSSYQLVFTEVKRLINETRGEDRMQLAEVQFQSSGIDVPVGNAIGIQGIPEGAPGGSTPGAAIQVSLGRPGQISGNQGGNNDQGHLRFKDIKVHDQLTNMTLSGWFKPTDVRNFQCMWGQGEPGAGIHYGIRGNDRKLAADNWGTNFNGTAQLNANEWVHVVFTYDSLDDDNKDTGTQRIYLNGVLDGERLNTKRPQDNGYLILAGKNGGGQDNYNGFIDEVAVWDKVICDDSIAALANGQSPLGPADEIPLAITNIATTGTTSNVDSVTITFTNTPGKIYRVERSSDLLNWEELDDGVDGPDYTDAFPTSGSAWYRVSEIDE